jgi:glycosyltransferase involved in cell wall biosynthesis
MKDVDSSLPHRPRVLAVLPAFIPSTVLTVVKPLTALHRAGRIVADITLEPWLSSRQIGRADVVVFSRNTAPHALDAALAHRKPIIYDIDDDLFEIPKTYNNALTPAAIAQLERYLSRADLVRAYSEPLKERVRRLNPRAHRVDCAVDWSLLPQSPPPRDPAIVRIVYATSRWQTDEMASLFADDLRRLLRAYEDRVQVFFWGYCPPGLRGSPGVRFLEFTPSYDKFFRGFARAGFDIGLAPLRDDGFHRSKCNNKFREYAACRIAGVYSDVEVYSSCVEDGRTGLLVSGGPGAWFEAVSRLVEDKPLRRRIQEEAFRFARERYRPEQSQAVWLAHINEVIAGAQREAAKRTRGRPEAARAQDGVSAPADRTPGARASASLIAKTVRRCVRLAAAVRAGGGRAALQWARLYANSLRELLRVRWSLSHASGRGPRRRLRVLSRMP